jgi:hypothetical protein
MREVQLDHVNPGCYGSLSAENEVQLQLLDTGKRNGAWHRRLIAEAFIGSAHNVVRPTAHVSCCNGRRAEPRSDSRCFAAGMSQLDANYGVLAVCQLGVLSQHVGMGVEPDT